MPVLLLLWALAPRHASAQFGTVTGRVAARDTGEVLAGANVTLSSDEERRGTATDRMGRFVFPDVPPGTFVLTVTHVGYAPRSDTIDVSFDQTVAVSVQLDPDEEALDEIVVEADEPPPRTSAGHYRVEPQELARVPLPDVTGDLAAYLLTRPGVVSAGDRGGQLFIRGGTPAQNLVLLDGMRIYQPFHIVGFYSVFPADLIATADVFAGGFGARYGGRISSVIDATTRSGSKERAAGSVSVAPFLASVQASVPVAPGRVSVLGSARESIIERVAPDVLGRELPYRFGDRFAKLHAYLNRTSSLAVTALHSFDEGNVAGRPGDDELSSWQNTSLGGRYSYLHPETPVMTEFMAYGTRYESRFIPSSGHARTSDITSYYGEMHIAYLLGPLDVHFGMFAATHLMDYDLGDGHSRVSENVTEVGTYATVPWDLARRLTLEPGLRIQSFTNGIGTAVEPRLRVEWQPGGILAGQRFNGAWGIYHQQLLGLNNQRDVTDAFFAWAPNPRFAPLPRSTHVILGTRRAVLPFLELSVESYRRSVENVSFALLTDDTPNATAALERVDGVARGIDLAAELIRPDVYLYAGYSLSSVSYAYESRRVVVRPDAEGMLQTGVETRRDSFSPPHDRRHQLNLIGRLSVGPFAVAARWQFGSGLPFTPIYGHFELPAPDPNSRAPLAASGARRVAFAEAYSKRLPSYHRLDVSAERVFDFGGWTLTIQAGVVNAYDRPNIFSYDLLLTERVDQLPVIPTLGLKVAVE